MKKIIILGVTLLSCLSVVGCSNGKEKTGSKDQKKESTSYYDESFMKAMASGLDARWDYIDSPKYKDDDTLTQLKNCAETEYNVLDKVPFSEKKFKDSKLKELALAYKNELENGVSIIDKETTSSLISYDSPWEKHYNNRTKLIVEINNIKEIPVKNKKQLKDLINNGTAVKKDEELKSKIEASLSKISFTEDPQNDSSSYRKYNAIVENDMGVDFKYFYANVYLEDSNGVRIETQYMHADDWNNGQKITVSFSTDIAFSSYKVMLDSFKVK